MCFLFLLRIAIEDLLLYSKCVVFLFVYFKVFEVYYVFFLRKSYPFLLLCMFNQLHQSKHAVAYEFLFRFS